jgi:AcrR family transcriptional regulator
MPRPTSADREDILNETRQCLLNAAIHEFAQHGYTGANINRISLSAGFAKGTIYNYFPSKRELMLALIDEIGALHSSFITARVEPENEPARRLQQFFQAGYAFVRQFPDHAQIAISSIYGFDLEFKQRVFDAYSDLFNLLIDGIVGEGMAQGIFKDGDPDELSGMVMSLYLGSCSLIGPQYNTGLSAERVTAFVLKGLTARSE